MVLTPALIDTGPIVSIFRSSQRHHAACVEALKGLRLPLLTCWPVITEAAHLLRNRPDQVAALLDSLSGGLMSLSPMLESDAAAVNAIMQRFSDQGFDLADASLMHLAERERVSNVFTLDLKDFTVFRNSKGLPLSVVPIEGLE